MSFNEFVPNVIQSMFFRSFRVRSYVYDNTFSLEEQIGLALEKVNENIEEVNNVESAIVLFESYVLSQLSNYDQKIIDDVKKLLDTYISDGTIGNLINQTIFGNINTSISNLTQTVANNKTAIEQTVATNQTNNNNSFQNVENEIKLINYRKPTLMLSIQPSQTLYNKGDTINSLVLNIPIVKGTDTLTELKIYKNGQLINSKLTNILDTESYTDGNIISDDVSYYVELNDGTSIVRSNEIAINFVYNFYTGVINSSATITDSLVRSLTPLKMKKDNLTYSYSPNDEKILVAYPSSYGTLTKIYDSNELQILDSFIQSSLNVTINGSQIPYNVYCIDSSVLGNNLIVNFEF